MKTPEISDWVTTLDRVHALVAATSEAGSRTEAARSLVDALAVLEDLHRRMLRAEVRATVSKTSAFGN